MLSQQGFDLWADQYDKTVQISEDKNQYPFAGYKKILNAIYNEIMQHKHAKVLDIGMGTGVLSSKLYQYDHLIDGIDFSPKMISIAQSKMPAAALIEWDISKGLPRERMRNEYDFIVSTYTLHHLADNEKITFITDLLSVLTDDGKILIGDIAFASREELNQCKQDHQQNWDDDEFYFVYNEIKTPLEHLCKCEFVPISHCGGVFIISK
ncbi:class I SAM-dependent methyltransferase [Cytobacillus gottheilii]|uniref:class I SAM-dependent methyltransferase n=1 Tax=Cytobacillus gottheilii TaxID=859144 RepID=UPI0009BA2CFF|nr:class I SAM-dependent methyltransferase [Cytobacillus gottheilii]